MDKKDRGGERKTFASFNTKTAAVIKFSELMKCTIL